jgi:hypothetical protein
MFKVKDVNNEIRLLLLIANELYRKDRVSSYRNLKILKKYKLWQIVLFK